MSDILYMKIDQNIEVDHIDVRLGDVAKLECTNASVKNRLKTLKLLKVQAEKSNRYVFSVMKVVELKVVLLCITIFIGSAFSIMTFNNDVGVTQVFNQVYELLMGRPSDGFTMLEITYSIGIAVGIIVFYNHFGGKRITKDPTPMEVQMRQYENDVNTTLVDGCNRKETSIDVD